MDWNALKLFLAIAESKTLSGAASHLGINHSTVFRRLNNFEEEIGGRLFERLAHGYELSPMGDELLLKAKKIADSFDDLERELVGKDFHPGGTVKITAPYNIAYRYLPHYLALFNENYPDIHIELLVSNQELNMTNRQADIAVRATSAPPEHLVGRKVCSLKWSFYASKAYLKAHGIPRTIKQIRNHTLIGATGSVRTLEAFMWLDKNIGQNIGPRCDELVAMAAFAEAGLGVALLPADQQRPALTNVFNFNTVKSSELWLLTHPDLRHVERIKLLMQHLAQCFSEETFDS